MIDELTASVNLILSQTQHNLQYLKIIVIVPWLVFFVSHFIDQRVLLLGIMPRKIYGLPGVLFAPLLHGNFNHIFFNTIPLVVLSNFVLINGLSYYLAVTILITLISGFAIWCFAKPGLHIGASALITGYWGLLVSNVYQTASVTTIILGIISIYYFAGIFFGIFPSKKGVSWEGHLFGLVAGFVTGYILTLYPVQNLF